jgi:type IV pilus assembly protein PilO
MKKSRNPLQILDPVFGKFENLSKLHRILVVCGTIAILVGGFTYFSYYPKLKTLNAQKKEYTLLQQKLTAAQQKAANLEKFREEKRKVEAHFQVVKKALPEKEDIPSLLAGVSQSGQDSGLDFVLFQPNPEVLKDFYAEIPVSINVTGEYHNVASFFDRVSRLSRIVDIKDIEITPISDVKTVRKASANSSQAVPANVLSTKCTAVTYKFVEKAPQQTAPDATKSKKSEKKK